MLVALVVLGTLLDDRHIRPRAPAIRSTAPSGCSHLVPTQSVARGHRNRAHQRSQDATYHKLSGSCGHVTTASRRPSEGLEASQLGLQKNPLVKFSEADFSTPPISCDGGDSRHGDTEQLRRPTPASGKAKCQSVVSKKTG